MTTVRWLGPTILITLAAPPLLRGDEPLHVRVDRLIDAAYPGPTAERAGDAEFLRRVWLDFAGTIPSSEQARAFLADPSPGKRETLIDALLAGPDHPRRMADALHVMLMERRGTNEKWRAFLRTSMERC